MPGFRSSARSAAGTKTKGRSSPPRGPRLGVQMESDKPDRAGIPPPPTPDEAARYFSWVGKSAVDADSERTSEPPSGPID